MLIFYCFWPYLIRHKNYPRFENKLLDNFFGSFHDLLILNQSYSTPNK